MTDTGSNSALRVFLCHASGDKPAVRELYRRLKTDGFAPWLDEEDLLPGQDWEREIPRAVRAADVVIVFLSHGSNAKAGYVQKEIKFALDVADEQPEGTIFLIPLKLEDCDVPERLSRWQWVDLLDAHGYDLLIRSLRTRAIALGLNTTRRSIAGLELVSIPAGKFIMGSEEYDREKPQHVVEIPYDYWISRYEVTNHDFAKFTQTTGYVTIAEWEGGHECDGIADLCDWCHPRGPNSSLHGLENHPVVYMTWYDAQAYCEWLTTIVQKKIPLVGSEVRLPTEAEWEKAARGEQGNVWPWGNEFDLKKCNSMEGGGRGTTSVDAYSPIGDSVYGVADMAGNVGEWTHSQFYSYPYRSDDGREEESDDDFDTSVVRSGAFAFEKDWVRCSNRHNLARGAGSEYDGFRVVIGPHLARFRTVTRGKK